MEDNIQLLLVEDDEDLQEEFLFYIQQNEKISLAQYTDSQSEALSRLVKGDIDAVLLDLELVEGDGISFLEEMGKLEIKKPLVIVYTNNRSNTVNCYIKELGADFVCYKGNISYSPEHILGMIVKMCPFHHGKRSYHTEAISMQKLKLEKSRRNRIQTMLSIMGVKIGSRGEYYLTEALYYAAFEIKSEDYLIQEVYDITAKRTNTRPNNVEKGVRGCIEKIWIRVPVEILQEYYPYPFSGKTGCPTNSEFIRNMARGLKGL